MADGIKVTFYVEGEGPVAEHHWPQVPKAGEVVMVDLDEGGHPVNRGVNLVHWIGNAEGGVEAIVILTPGAVLPWTEP